jgi:hypothetical protein
MSVLGTLKDPRLEAVLTSHAPERMRGLLDAWFARAGRAERVVSLAVQRVFYMPGIDFNAVYALELERGSERESQLLFGDLCYDADAPALVAKAERKTAKGEVRGAAPGFAGVSLCRRSAWRCGRSRRSRLRSFGPRCNRRRWCATPGPAGGPGPNGGNGWVLRDPIRRWCATFRAALCVFRYGVEWKLPPSRRGRRPTSILQHLGQGVRRRGGGASGARDSGRLRRGSLRGLAVGCGVPRRWRRFRARHPPCTRGVHGESDGAPSRFGSRPAGWPRSPAVWRCCSGAAAGAAGPGARGREFEKMRGQAHLVAMIHP